jgi:hypothetical protein
VVPPPELPEGLDEEDDLAGALEPLLEPAFARTLVPSKTPRISGAELHLKILR